MILSRADIDRGDVIAVRSTAMGTAVALYDGEGTTAEPALRAGMVEIRQRVEGVQRRVAIYGGTFVVAIVSRASLGLPGNADR